MWRSVGSTTCSDIEADNAAPNWIWPERSTFARARSAGGMGLPSGLGRAVSLGGF